MYGRLCHLLFKAPVMIMAFTLPETNMTPENGRLEDEYPFGWPKFQGRTVSFRECNPDTSGLVNQIVRILFVRAKRESWIGSVAASGSVVDSSHVRIPHEDLSLMSGTCRMNRVRFSNDFLLQYDQMRYLFRRKSMTQISKGRLVENP